MDSADPERLYAERGSVPLSKPLLQGDVFENVSVPILGDDPLTVQVVNHPCTMRHGMDFVERMSVAPVRSYSPINESVWQKHL